MRIRAAAVLAALSLSALSLTACSSSPTKLHLGYLPDLNQAMAIVGIEKNYFGKQLGHKALVATAFNSDIEAATAVAAGTLDAAFVGPNAALQAYSKSGHPIRVLSGESLGGVSFIANAGGKSSINFAGKTVAIPGAGGTQDVALRTWLANQGYKAGTAGKAVRVAAIAPKDVPSAFAKNTVQGAWLPEPWASLLVDGSKGTEVVNEADLWQDGLYSSNVLIVNKAYLDAHPDTVSRLLQGFVAASGFVHGNAAATQNVVTDTIAKQTGVAIPATTMQKAWQSVTFTFDPAAVSIFDDDANAGQVGLMKSIPIAQMFDLTRINVVLKSKGIAQVQAQ